MSRMTDLLALTYVPRWCIVPMLRQQSVAEHSHRVAVIARELAERLRVDDIHPHELYAWAIAHDGPEARSGDISSLFKRSIDDAVHSAELTNTPWISEEMLATGKREMMLVKLADYVEAYTWIQAWGQGAHAARVAEELRIRMLDFIDACETALKVAWSVRVGSLIDEILFERGR